MSGGLCTELGTEKRCPVQEDLFCMCEITDL